MPRLVLVLFLVALCFPCDGLRATHRMGDPKPTSSSASRTKTVSSKLPRPNWKTIVLPIAGAVLGGGLCELVRQADNLPVMIVTGALLGGAIGFLAARGAIPNIPRIRVPRGDGNAPRHQVEATRAEDSSVPDPHALPEDYESNPQFSNPRRRRTLSGRFPAMSSSRPLVTKLWKGVEEIVVRPRCVKLDSAGREIECGFPKAAVNNTFTAMADEPVPATALVTRGQTHWFGRTYHFLKLLFRSEKGGKIRITKDTNHFGGYSPFHKLPAEEFPYMVRMLWYLSQYGYSSVHYRPRVASENRTRGESEVAVVRQLEAMKGENVKGLEGQSRGGRVEADAAVSFVHPPTGSNVATNTDPAQWYCEKLHGDWCKDFGTKTTSLFVAFRGMRLVPLVLGAALPPSDDLENMRGLIAVEDCTFTTADNIDISVPQVTQGSCKLLKSLVVKGLFDEITPYIDDALANRQRLLVLFGGLSFGGAIGQVAIVAFNEYIRVKYSTTPLPANWIRTDGMFFGSPRVGGSRFKAVIENVAPTINQFAMFTYPALARWEEPTERLQYDPVVMWPSRLHNVGNVHTLMFHRNKSGKTITHISHDLRSYRDAPYKIMLLQGRRNAVSRKFAELSPLNFICTHNFEIYKAMLERVEASAWCSRLSISEMAFPLPPDESPSPTLLKVQSAPV